MQKVVALTLVFVFTTLTLARPILQDTAKVQPAASTTEVQKPESGFKVSDGTEVEVLLKNNASAEELKVGSIVDFAVMRPVVINGVTVFKEDAPARARVTTAKKAGRWGRAGKLEWAMQDVEAADGTRVPARFTKRSIGDSKGGTVAVAAVATTVLLGPLGLLWGLKKGKPAIIPAGNRYSIFVSGDTVLDAAKLPNTAVSVSGAQAANETSSVVVSSTPAGADITIDGKFVGNTPSTLKLAPGDHTILIASPGFKPWQRSISVGNGGNVSVDATLEKLR